MLTSEATMAYFDPDKETELTTDAFPVGLSAILAQRTPGQNGHKIVAYASRSLSDVERRYSQTEKAIVWSIERLQSSLHCTQTASRSRWSLAMPSPNHLPELNVGT